MGQQASASVPTSPLPSPATPPSIESDMIDEYYPEVMFITNKTPPEHFESKQNSNEVNSILNNVFSHSKFKRKVCSVAS